MNGQLVSERVGRIAKYQRWFLLVVLLNLLSPSHYIVFIPAALLVAIFMFRLATLLEMKSPMAIALACSIPIIGIAVVLHVNGRATSLLQWHGLRVGLLGVRPDDYQITESR